MFSGLPAPESGQSRAERRAAQRRSQTEDEKADERIAHELADLPDDEGTEEEDDRGLEELIKFQQQQEQPEQHLRKRPRHGMDEDEAAAPVSTRRTQEAMRAVVTQQVEAPEVKQEVASAAHPDQVAVALARIASHIGNPGKFAKASPLLRQLLEGEALGRTHRTLAFDAVRAAFPPGPASKGADKHLVDVVNRREVMKLAAAIVAKAQVGFFNKAERLQINRVYVPLAVTRSEMNTDDGFVFSKAIAQVRERVNSLPDPLEGVADADVQLAAWQHVTQNLPGTALPQPSAKSLHTSGAEAGKVEDGPDMDNETLWPCATELLQQAESVQKGPQVEIFSPEATAAAASTDDPFGIDALVKGAGHGCTPVEDDPFGLGSLMQASLPPEPRPAKDPKRAAEQSPVSHAWAGVQLLAAEQCTALALLQHARTLHKHAWAQTGIELLVEYCFEKRDRFNPGQHEDIDAAYAWVRKARAERKKGPSAKELGRDSTSFERARAEWGKATVSTRGKVGSQGDSKSAHWLG